MPWKVGNLGYWEKMAVQDQDFGLRTLAACIADCPERVKPLFEDCDSQKQNGWLEIKKYMRSVK